MLVFVCCACKERHMENSAHAMSGEIIELVACVETVAPLKKCTQCLIQWEALATKKMPDSFFKRYLMKLSRFLILTKLCKEMRTQYMQLFLHTEMCWLLRGNFFEALLWVVWWIMTFSDRFKFPSGHLKNFAGPWWDPPVGLTLQGSEEVYLVALLSAWACLISPSLIDII